MKKFLLIFLCLSFIQNALANTIITGEVQYNVQSARNELQNSPQPTINQQFINNMILDPFFTENQNYILQGEVDLKDRSLAFFSDNTYAVIYNNDKLKALYYSPKGILFAIEVKNKLDYPYKSYKFDLKGKLLNMSIRQSKTETFIYERNGKLIAHWLGTNAYDEFGNIIMTRKYYE